MICVSGGGNSASLLKFVSTCMDISKTKKIKIFHPVVLYINDGALYDIEESIMQ